MDKEAIKGYDFSEDTLKPREIMSLLSSHDSRMESLQPDMAIAKSSYMTRFWRFIEGQERFNASQNYELSRLDQIEVNRVKPAISGYLSALYPRRINVVCSDSPYTTGDAQKAQLLLTDWINKSMMRERILNCSRQALLYKGAGAKIGYDSAGEGLDRVWMRVFPYWEMVLDHDVHDREDQRFVGHVSFRPKQQVIEEYGLDDDISGTSRDDYLSSHLSQVRKFKDSGESGEEKQAFVRVLEFCNLVDNYYDMDGTRYKGRLEIYVMGGYEDSEPFPVYMGPLPLVDHNGHPMAHIVPLLFEYEPEYPLRGVSYVDQLMPQQKEINALRSFTSVAARRDARIYLARKGSLDADAYTDLKSGEDGLIIEVDEQYAGNLRDVVVPIQHGNLSANLMESMRLAEFDMDRSITVSPAALGQVTKATAEEIRAVERHTESEFGRHAEQRDIWLLELLRRCLAAHVAAMYDKGDSEGGEQNRDEEGNELDKTQLRDKRETEDIEVETQKSKEDEGFEPHPMYHPETGQAEIADEHDEHLALGEKGYTHKPPEGTEDELEETDTERTEVETERTENRTINLRTPQGEILEVIAEDLHSDFEIGFSEAGRSPQVDADLRANLIGLMDRILQLNDMSFQGGPMGVVANELLVTMHERFKFPPNLHPDYIQGLVSKLEEEEPQPEEAPPSGPEQAPPSGPEQVAQPEPASIEEVLGKLEQMPPEQALMQLKEIFADNPQLLQIIDQSLQTEAPEQQLETVQMILAELRKA